MFKKIDKRKFYGTIVGVVLFIVTILTFTYASYNWRSNNSVVTFNIQDKYFFCETDLPTNVSTSLSPVNNYKQGLAQTFKVNNIGNDATTFSLSMRIDSISDVLKHESFKFKLVVDTTNGNVNCSTTDCTTVAEGNFANVHVGMNTLVQSITLPENSRYMYYLFMYLDAGMSNPTGIQNGRMTAYLGVCDIYVYFDANTGCGESAGSVTPVYKRLAVGDKYGTLPTTAGVTTDGVQYKVTRNNAVLTYNTLGGSAAPSATINFSDKLAGWYKNANGTGSAITSTQDIETTENHTLYAKWNTPSAITLPTRTTVSKAGNTLTGWYSEETGGTLVGNPGASYTLNCTNTLYARWVPNTVTVNIKKNNANWSASGIKVCLYKNGSIAKNANNQEMCTTVTSGYTATWSEVPDGTYTVYAGERWNAKTALVDTGRTITITTPTANGVANAQTPSTNINYYDITLTASQGIDKVKLENTNVTSGTGYPYLCKHDEATGTCKDYYRASISATLKNGYTWSGWTKTDTTNFNYLPTNPPFDSTSISTTVIVDKQYKLTAATTGNQYTITYDYKNGIAGTNAPTVGTFDQDVVISNPSKPITITINNTASADLSSTTVSVNLPFAGWTSSQSDGLGNTAKVGASNPPTSTWSGSTTALTHFMNLTDVANGNVKMTANWTAKTVTLPTVTKAGKTCFFIDTAHNNTKYTSGASYIPDANGTRAISLTSSCVDNEVTIKIKKGNSNWSNSGMNVALYQEGVLKYAYNAATVSENTNTITWSGVEDGTYDVYAGKNNVLASNKSSLVNSGVAVKITTCAQTTKSVGTTVTDTTPCNTPEDVFITYYDLTLTANSGFNQLKMDNQVITSGTAYQYLSGQTSSINAIVASGYTWNNWTVTSGATPANVNNASTTVTLNQQTSLTANANTNQITVKINQNDTNTAISGMKVCLSTSGSTNTEFLCDTTGNATITFTTSSGSPIEANTNYYIWAGKNNVTTANKSNTIYTETIVVPTTTGTSTSGTASIYYYTLALTKGASTCDASKLSIATVSIDGEEVQSGTGYSFLKPTSSAQTVAISSTATTGYTWNKWTVTSGTTPANVNNQSTTVALTQATSLKATATCNTYTINYNLNNGSFGSSHPTSASYDTDVVIDRPSKTITITGVENGTGATIGEPTTINQTGKWSSSKTNGGLGDNATSGTTAKPTTLWTGTATTNTHFMNLRDGSGTVTFTANYSNTGVVPTITKAGYVCGWMTSANGTSIQYVSGAAYTPTNDNAANVTLYGICVANMITIHLKKNNTNWTDYAWNVALHKVDNDAVIYVGQPTSGTVTFVGVENGTYNIYAQDSLSQSPIDTGKTVTMNNTSPTEGASVDVDLKFYSISLSTSLGINTVQINSTNVTSGTSYWLPENRSITINATVGNGYAWKNWTAVNETPLPANSEFNHQNKNTTVVMDKGYTLQANANINKIIVQTKLNGTLTTINGLTIAASTSSTSSASSNIRASGTTSGNSIELKTTNTSSGALITGTQYYIWAGKSNVDNNQKQELKYTEVSATPTIQSDGTVSATVEIDYHTLKLIAGTGIATLTINGSTTTANQEYAMLHENTNGTIIEATTSAGYTFDKWTEGSEQTSVAAKSIKMNTSHIYTATATPITYNISYTCNNATSNCPGPTTATYDQAVNIPRATKNLTVTGNAGSTGCVAGAATSSTKTANWSTSSTLASTALAGTSTSNLATWDGTAGNYSYFKNLLTASGTVTLTANFSGNIATPTFTTHASGYTCYWKYTKPDNTTVNVKGGGSITPPSNSPAAITVTAQRVANSITITRQLSGNPTNSSNIKVALYKNGVEVLPFTQATVNGANVKWETGVNGAIVADAPVDESDEPYEIWASKIDIAGAPMVNTGQTITLTTTNKTTANTATGIIDYYPLTLTKGSYIAAVSMDGINVTSGTAYGVLLNKTVSIGATGASGYGFGEWVKNSGNDPASTSANPTNVTITQATSITANAAVNSISVKTRLNGAQSTINGLKIGISNSSTTPPPTVWTTTASSDTVTFTTNDDIQIAGGATYYVWAGTDNVSNLANMEYTNQMVTYVSDGTTTNVYTWIDYYTLTLTSTAGISDIKINNAGTSYIFLKNKTASISATLSPVGYTWDKWTVTSGNSPASVNNQSTTVTLTQQTSLKANANPITYNIDYTCNYATSNCPGPTTATYDSDVVINQPLKTITYTVNLGSTGCTANATSPTLTGNWTSNTNDGLSTLAMAGTSASNHTTWNGSSSGNKTHFKNLRETSSGSVTLTANFATTIAAPAFSSFPSGSTCYWEYTPNGGTTSTIASGGNITVAQNVTSIAFTAVQVQNYVEITVNKNGSAWQNSGMNVALYQNGTQKYSYANATKSGATVRWNGVANGTYNIYISKDYNNLTTLVDSGETVNLANGTTGAGHVDKTVNYYTLSLKPVTASLLTENCTMSSLKMNNVAVTASTDYAFAKDQKVTIAATAASGFTWKEWGVLTSAQGGVGNTPSNNDYSATSATTYVTMDKQYTLTAIANANSVTLTTKLNGTNTTMTGFTIALSDNTSSNTSVFSTTPSAATITFSSTCSGAKVAANTEYYIWAGKNDVVAANKTTPIYTGNYVKATTSGTTSTGTADVNYYSLTLNKSTGISSVTIDSTQVSAGSAYYFLKTTSNQTPSISANLSTGYSWVNWTIGATTTQFSASRTTNVTMNAQRIYKANAQLSTYTVTLNKNTGTQDGTTSVTATYNTAMPAITIPKKEYTVSFDLNSTGASATTTDLKATYTFLGYFKESDGSGTQYYKNNGTSNHNWDIASAATLYAKWEQGHGTVGVTLPTITMIGSVCRWNTKSDGSGTYYDGGATYKPTANTTFYAKCQVSTYQVTFTSSPTTCGGATMTNVNVAGTYLGVSVSDGIISKAKPSCAGYVFQGWTATGLNTSTAKYGNTSPPATAWSNGNTKIGATYSTTYFKTLAAAGGNVTLTANFRKAAVIVKYNINGSTFSTDNQYLSTNSDGWVTKTGTTSNFYAADNINSPSTDYTSFHNFASSAGYVSFPTPNVLIVPHDQGNLNLANPTNSNFINMTKNFYHINNINNNLNAAWNTAANGSGTAVSAEANGVSTTTLKSLAGCAASPTSDCTVPLYANWIANTLSVRWKLGTDSAIGTTGTYKKDSDGFLATCTTSGCRITTDVRYNGQVDLSTYNSVITPPSGYTLTNWASSNGSQHAATAKPYVNTLNNLGSCELQTKTNAACNLTAVFKRTVTHNINGGTNPNSNPTSVTCTYNANCSALTSTNYTAPSGYQFWGWGKTEAKAKSGNVEVQSGGSIKNYTGNLWASWGKAYTLRYYVNTTNYQEHPVTCYYGQNTCNVTLGSTYPHTDFLGFATSAANSHVGTVAYQCTDSNGCTFNIYGQSASTLYPVHKYVVYYHKNGGTGSNYTDTANPCYTHGNCTLANGSKFTAPSGKKFKGWALTSTGAVKYTASQVVTNLINVSGITFNSNDRPVLYAVWK